MKSQLIDIQTARAAAKRLYQKVSFSGGPLQSYEISSLLTETYDYLKIPFKPSSKDIKAYTQVLDANKDGQVTLGDVQTLAINFLNGPGVLANQTYDKKGSFQTQGPAGYTFAQNNTLNYNNYQTVTKDYSENISALKSNENQRDTAPKSNLLSNEKQYNQQTLNILNVARGIFESHADSSYTVTEPVISDLLSKTYETLGRKGYRPSEQDVKVWIKLCDGNGDGHVQYEEYEYFVVRSLERSGFQVYDN